MADLEAAARAIETRADEVVDAQLRADYQETAVAIFDQLIALELKGGQAERAFRQLERSRGDLARLSRVASATRSATHSVVALRTVMDRLAPGEVLIEYASLPQQLHVWTITRDELDVDTVPVGRAALASTVAAWQRAVLRDSDEADIARRSAELYALLLAPVAAHIDSANALVIVPDHAVHGVAFGSLRANGSDPFLIARFPIRTLSSAAELMRAARWTPTEHDRILLAAGPAIDTRLFPELRPLPGARDEADRIARLYEAHTIVAGKDVTRAALLGGLPRHSILHFAGHARFRDEAPEQSFLALASGAGDEPGLIRTWEIAMLDLPDLALVVLSACSTSSRSATRVGGFSGLAEAFLRAGAHGVVGTLWDVDDRATADLVVTFHELLRGGAAPAEALRQAQLAAIEGGSAAMRDWSAFRYHGN
jgi:CHAT domain-containing protein